MEFNWFESAEARVFIAKVQQHYRRESEAYKKFISVARLGNVEMIRAQVHSLFPNNLYLVHEFKRLLPPLPPVPDTTSSPISAANNERIERVIKFLIKAKAKITDPDLYRKFLVTNMSFQNKPAPRGLNKEKYLSMLDEYPELKSELSAILLDDMYHNDVLFHRMLCARDSAERLISENQSVIDGMDKKIDVSAYFSDLDFKCVEELEDSRILLSKDMSRKMAVLDSMEIRFQLDYKIRDFAAMRGTDDEMDELKIMKNHQEEFEIPKWDWHLQLSDDMHPHLPVEMYEIRKGRNRTHSLVKT